MKTHTNTWDFTVCLSFTCCTQAELNKKYGDACLLQQEGSSTKYFLNWLRLKAVTFVSLIFQLIGNVGYAL